MDRPNVVARRGGPASAAAIAARGSQARRRAADIIRCRPAVPAAAADAQNEALRFR